MGDCGRGWEILRGFEWGVGWYAVSPVPATKQGGSQNLSTALKKSQNSHEQHLLRQSSSRYPEISPWQALGTAFAAARCTCAATTNHICVKTAAQPVVISSQVASKSPLYHGSATSRSIPAQLSKREILFSGSPPKNRFILMMFRLSIPMR